MKTYLCTIRTYSSVRGTPFGSDRCEHEVVEVVSPTGRAAHFQLRFLSRAEPAVEAKGVHAKMVALLAPLTATSTKKGSWVEAPLALTADEMRACLDAEYWHNDRMEDYAS